MAKREILSTAEFLAQMRKTPLGSTTNLTFGDAQVLSRSGIDISNYGNESNEYVESLQKEEQESASWWNKFFGTIDNIANSFGKGFVSMFEGIVDFGVTIAGDVGSWFGASTDWAEDFVKVDMAGNLANFTETFGNFTPWGIAKTIKNASEYGSEYWSDFGKAWSTLGLGLWGGVTDEEYTQWREKYAYSHDVLEKDTGWFGQAVLGVAEGAGQLVGMYLTAGLGGAADLSAKGAQVLGLAAMSVGAAGKGTEQALEEGANIHQATLYGVLTGAVEAGTEMIGGIGTDVASGIIGKAALKNAAVKKFTSTLAGKMVAGFLSEGLEEVLSDVANPLLKKISYDYDMNLGEEYGSGEFWSGLTQSFVVGGLLGAIGEGGQYYRLGKTTINQKTVGQKGAIAYSEFADAKDDLTKRAKKLNKTFSQIVEDANIDISEKTNIDAAYKQVAEDPNLSETQREKLKNALDKAYKANKKYIAAQDNLLAELQDRGITADDLKIEYENKVTESAKKVADEIGIDVENTTEVSNAIKNNTEIMDDITNGNVGSFYDGESNIVLVGENQSAETISLNSLEKLKIANSDLYADVMDIADQLVSLDPDFSQQVDKYTKIYQTQNGLSLDEATKLARQTALANRLAVYFKSNPNALKNVKHIKEIVKTMQNSLVPLDTGVDTVGISPEPMLPTETSQPIDIMNEEMGALARSMEQPDTGKKVRVGKSAVKSTATWLENISYQTETLAVKLTNSAAAIENGFRRLGVSQREAMMKTDQVRTAQNIANSVFTNGFTELTEDGKSKQITKGLYNGKDGIQDILESKILEKNQGFSRKQALETGMRDFYESLALYVEKDRLVAQFDNDLITLDQIKRKVNQKEPKARKTVLGKWFESRNLTTEEVKAVEKHFPLLAEAIQKGVALDEATFNDLAHKTATERNIELEGDALETYKQLEKHLRLLNEEDINNRLSQIDEKYPFFAEMREEVWKYNRQLLKMQFEGGYLTAEAYGWLKDYYSHYVPTYREMIINQNADISMSVTSSTLKQAKGSDLVIKDMFDSMQTQTMKIHQKVALNELIREFVQANNGELNDYVISKELLKEEAPRSTDTSMTYYLSRPALDGKTITYYENGEAHSFLVSNNVMEGFQSLAGVYNDTLLAIPGMKYVAKAQKLVKNLLTTYNPFFGLRNAIRDLWDAMFYSPTGMTSVLRNLPKAYKSIISNDIDYQTFVANGGVGTSIMTTTEIYTDKKKVSSKLEYIIKPWKAIERVNEIIEVATRYAQYLATVDSLTKERAKGKNNYSQKQIITRGVYEAHEITLNFSRSGTVGRQINNTFGLFLNANIQGFTKMARTFISPKTTKEWAELLLKLLILGIGAQLANELIYFDDEDYQSLSTSVKNNYYLIKAGDQFIRIPKGRVISAFNAIVTGTFGKAKGDDKVMEDSLKYALLEANTPVQGFTLGFFQAIDDASKNRTWYGGEIVTSKWDNTRPTEQYEKNTSYISRWLGKALNTSPLKVQYVLDQYSGIVGDILLPMTSDEASGYKLYRIVKDQYLIDPVEKNKYAKDFSDYKQQVTYDKTDGDAIATIQVSYLNKASSEIKELREQIKEIDADASLSAKEKNDQTKTVQVMINLAYKEAIENSKAMGEALKNYTITEDNINEVSREVAREVLGAESALRIYNKNVYAKAQCYYKAGVSYDDFYVYYFNMRNFATKDEAERYVSRLRISPQLKNLIYRLAGWQLGKDKEEILKRWLKNRGLTDDEIALIL